MAGRNVQLSLDGSNAGSSINDWDVIGGLTHHASLNSTNLSYYLETDLTATTNTFTVSSPGSFVVGEVVKFLSVQWRYGSNVTTNSRQIGNTFYRYKIPCSRTTHRWISRTKYTI